MRYLSMEQCLELHIFSYDNYCAVLSHKWSYWTLQLCSVLVSSCTESARWCIAVPSCNFNSRSTDMYCTCTVHRNLRCICTEYAIQGTSGVCMCTVDTCSCTHGRTLLQRLAKAETITVGKKTALQGLYITRHRTRCKVCTLPDVGPDAKSVHYQT